MFLCINQTFSLGRKNQVCVFLWCGFFFSFKRVSCPNTVVKIIVVHKQTPSKWKISFPLGDFGL